jgi:WD40 repeat protein
MTSGQPKRKRGVVLTPTGRQKLQDAIKVWEEQDNFGDKLTIEELSDRTKLDAGTVAKVVDAEEGVDRRTLERFFQAFSLELTPDDYGKPFPTSEKRLARETRVDWGEAVDVSIFYGRTAELETLTQWVVSDRCRLIALLGMGGIGKTSLAAKLGEQVQDEFDYVVWRSLREAPPLKEILTSLIQFLSNQQETEADLPESLGGRITKLVEHLRFPAGQQSRTHRCLLILDNAESILQEGQAGVYREGYEGYGELLKRVGESSHQSCLVVTSREKPRELSAMEGEAFLVRSLQLRGVEDVDGQEILRAKGIRLSETADQEKELIHRCAGNPLALKLVATTIQELFDGDVAEFLKEETIAFEGVRDLLDQHFNRLSELEKSVMYWLAINREPVSVQELQEDIVPPVTKPRLLEALKGLVGRSLVEKNEASFTLQNVVMEYMIDQLVEKIRQEIKLERLNLFSSHALVKATAQDYIRETQIRLIIQPIVDSFLDIEKQIVKCLENLKSQLDFSSEYACGNALNLLFCLNADISGHDFSRFRIWYGYLRGEALHNVNFSYCDFRKSVFTETFSTITSVTFNSDGKLLAAGDAMGGIRVWRTIDYHQLLISKEHTSMVEAIVFSSNGQMLASSSSDRTIRVWDTHTGQCLHVLYGHSYNVRSIEFSPNNQILVSGSSDQTVRIWNVQTGQCLKVLQAHDDRVLSVSFSPDGQKLASTSADCTVKIWDVKTSQCLVVLQEHTEWVTKAIFSPDEQILATASSDRTVKLWDLKTDRCLRTLAHTSRIRSISFGFDGQTLASGNEDNSIKIWDIKTGQCLRTLQGHSKRVSSVAFKSNRLILASGSDDHTVRIWNVETGQCLRIIQGYTNWVTSIAFNPDGQMIAGNNSDHTVKIWDFETGQCLKTFQGHSILYAAKRFTFLND